MGSIRRSYAAIVLLALSAGVHAEEIRVGGGAAPIENIFRKIKLPFEERTGIQLSLRADRPDKALADLAAGKVDVAAAGLSAKDLMDFAKKNGVDVGNPADYKSRVLGSDSIQVLMHKDLASIKALNKDQLKSVFTGQVTSWKQVGGPDLPVIVVFGAKMPGTNGLWQERIMDGANWLASRREAGDASQVKKMVSAVPGAVSIGPLASERDGAVHSPETPEISRPITALTKGAPSPSVQKLYDFIQGDGQQHIVK